MELSEISQKEKGIKRENDLPYMWDLRIYIAREQQIAKINSSSKLFWRTEFAGIKGRNHWDLRGGNHDVRMLNVYKLSINSILNHSISIRM